MLTLLAAIFFAQRAVARMPGLYRARCLLPSQILASLKRATVTVTFFGALVALGGCPSTTTSDNGCYRNSDCAQGLLCDHSSGECFAPSDAGYESCRAPTDCAASFTCGKNGRCMPGDCYFNDCVTGFQCGSSTGTWECLPSSAGAAGAGGDQDANQAGTGGEPG
jgi:hypothetical protein